jgi:hypothetical protein
MKYCPTIAPRLSYMKKHDLERIFGLKVYVAWKAVPSYLKTKTEIRALNLNIKGRIPVAIKSSIGTKSAYYLYDCRLVFPTVLRPVGKIYFNCE